MQSTANNVKIICRPIKILEKIYQGENSNWMKKWNG